MAEAIDRRLQLLKIHLPYHESDHVLNFAFNALCDGTCLEDLELRRQDEGYLEAVNARRIPDPTTAGDFCRRFQPHDVRTLLDVINETRLKIWAQQPDEFFAEAAPRHGRHAGVDQRRVQAGDGHRVQRHLGLSSAGGDVWPTPARCFPS